MVTGCFTLPVHHPSPSQRGSPLGRHFGPVFIIMDRQRSAQERRHAQGAWKKAKFPTALHGERRAAGISVINALKLPRRSPNGESPGQSQSKGSPPAPIIAKFVTLPNRNAALNAFEQQQRLRVRAAASATQPGPPLNRISVKTDLPPALKAHRAHSYRGIQAPQGKRCVHQDCPAKGKVCSQMERERLYTLECS